MNYLYYEIKKLPVVIIDNYYSNQACQKIWQELCFLNNDPNKFKTPKDTGSAYTIADGEKVMLKDNLALGLDIVYLNRQVSSILTENRKIFSEEVMLKLEELHHFFKYVRLANKDSTLVNYYENSHYYKPHLDESTVTTLSFFYQQPRLFTGGDLIIENELKIECQYNRFVVFPSILMHEVESVSLSPDLAGENFGRYSITQLMATNV
jgi:hypothetical protein